MEGHFIGLMSGTSADGIDAIAVTIAEPAHFQLLATHSEALPSGIRRQIEALLTSGPDELHRMAVLDVELGGLFAQAALTVMGKAGLTPRDTCAIGSHGQTLRHHPQGGTRYTLQIGDPSVIAQVTGVTTVADFRRRDLAAGGQGAPLVPAFHAWLFRHERYNRVIVNIGGIANLTWLPADRRQPVTGFDTGPGNTLLDQWASLHRGEPCDVDGRWGASGTINEPLLNALLDDPYIAAPPPKSTGRDHFHLDWLTAALSRTAPACAPVDVQATLAALTVQSIALAIRRHCPALHEVYVCGGGWHNLHLRALLGEAFGARLIGSSAVLGLDPDWVEAAAFAWLAHQTLLGRSGNLPTVTGAREAVVLGGVYGSAIWGARSGRE